MATLGVVSVAYGPAARQAVAVMLAGLRRYAPGLSATIIGDELPDTACEFVNYVDAGYGARRAKLNLLTLCNYDHILYLDADTEPLGDPGAGFALLADGYDLVLTPSINQDGDVLAHIADAERRHTLECVFMPLQLQAGVMFINRNPRTLELFWQWRIEWEIYAQQDQAALLRALEQVPVKIWLLGRDWNGGALIAHHFGKARA